MKNAATTFHSLQSLAALAGTLSLVEAALIIPGLLPPVLSYSPGNILFSIAKLAVAAWAGTTLSPRLGKAALGGAAVSLAGVGTLCIASLAGMFLLNAQVLGISAPGTVALAVLTAVILVENTALGAVVAACAAWAAGRINWKKR